MRIVQFARAPVPGAVKTRLIPALGADAACTLHCRLVEHTTQRLLAAETAALELYTDDTNNDWLQRHAQRYALPLCLQRGDDLGARMFAACADQPAKPTIIVGSDCPALDADYLGSAIDALRSANVVIGPACDGGYVLIGTQTPQPGLFKGIDWGSDKVLAQTLACAAASGLPVVQLAELRDIDRPEDLASLPDYGIATD